MTEQEKQERINNVWWSGFCHETVEFSATTFDDPDGGTARRSAFTREHINRCHQCALAFTWKNAEAELARRLDCFEFFVQGGDIFERYGDRARREFAKMLQETKFPAEMLDFVHRVSKRHGKPYPGRPGSKKGTWKA